MNTVREAKFEEALTRLRPKWARLQDHEVNYHFPIPETTMKEMFLAQVNSHPDKVYIRHHGRQQTYRECNVMAVQIANGLRSLGLTKGDRIITFVSNSMEFVAIAQACFKTGIIMVNSNPLATDCEIASRIQDCTPRVAIADAAGVQAVMRALRTDRVSVEHIVGCPAVGAIAPADGLMPWEALLSDDLTEPDVVVRPEDCAVLQYTGGTTGVLKGCCETNYAFVAKALAQSEYFKPILNDEDREHYMVMMGLGLSHAFGFVQSIVVNMSLGGAIYFADSLEEILTAIETYRPTVWPSVPVWMKLIASDPQYQKHDITSLKCITCGSAPLPVEVLQKVEQITGAAITEGYGMTETVNTITINSFHHRKAGTVGVPNPNIEYLIVDQETGEQVMADGEAGEIICRGACVMKEYWKKPEETANALRDGWLYTGDIGYIDEEGYLVIKDRKKDMIIVSGFNVFPRELEDVVLQYPGVADACAIGIPHPRRGEVPAVFIQPRRGVELDLNEISAFCEQRLSRYKLPKRFFLIPEIPKTKNRKPDRKQLRKEYDQMPDEVKLFK